MEEEIDEKIVDEEFNLTSSEGSSSGSGKRDSDFLKELMKPPVRTKFNTVQALSSHQRGKSKDTGDYGSGEYVDEIDEFIKKHIENEEKERQTADAKKLQAKRFQSASYDGSDSSGGE